MKKKKIVILVVISVLVLCVIGFGVNKIFFQDNSEIVESKEEKKNRDNDTKKNEQEKEDNSEEQEVKEENIDESSVESEEESTVSSNNSKSNTSSNSSSYNSQSQTTNNSSSVSTSQETPSTPQTPPTESQTPPQEQQPLTAWEQLGISKEEYYNTPLIAGDEVAFSGDISVCEAEVNRLVSTYYRQGLSGGNSYDVIGKYTHSHIGCGLNVYINGVKYSYSQAKAMGFN